MQIELITFREEFRRAFYELNAQWLNHYYFVTPEDEKLLNDPEKIVANGGQVFFALLDNQPVGTCALIPEGENVFELIKMGVDPIAQGKGIGSLLLEQCIRYARNKGSKMITLETATPLKAAIHLYEKFGFIKTSEEYTHPVFKRTTFKMKLDLTV